MKKEDKISALYHEQVSRLVDSQDETGNPATIIPGETDEIWEDICARLDIEEVWNKVSSGLDTLLPPDNGPGFFYKSCAAVLITLASLVQVEKEVTDIPAVTDSPDSGSKYYSATGSNNLNYSKAGIIIPNIYENNREDDPFATNGTRIQNERVLPGYDRKVSDGRVTIIPEMGGDIDLMVASDPEDGQLALISTADPHENADNLTIPVSSTPEIRALTENLSRSGRGMWLLGESTRSNPPEINRARFTGGFITSFRNTWLLNQETFDGLRPESLSTTEFVVFPDAGLCLGYRLTQKLSLQTDAFLFSSTGQGYQEYIFGRYSRKKIVLRYSTLVVSLKYKTGYNYGNLNRSSVNLSAGGYISILQNADQTINTDVRKISSNYSKLDFGTKLSGEFELRLSDYLSVAPGLNFTMGLTNIFRGDGQVPGYMRRTHNASAGIQLSFYWNLD